MKNIRATWGVEELSTNLLVAQGSTPTLTQAMSEAVRYALQYGQDGPVKYWVKKKNKVIVKGEIKGVTIEEY